MLKQTALMTLLATLLIGGVALMVERGGYTFGPAAPVALTGASANWSPGGERRDWGGGPYAITGASQSWSAGGGRGDWGRGTSAITGASGSWSSRGERGDWDHESFDDDGWHGDDD